jgi:hypothetical protein
LISWMHVECVINSNILSSMISREYFLHQFRSFLSP